MLFSCGKDDEATGTPPEPVPRFTIQFYVIDSLDNLVFPANGTYISNFTPDEFSAASEFTGNIPTSYNPHNEYGHIFRFSQSTTVISENEYLWSNDSTIEFYTCFSDLCDTIYVFNPLNGSTASSAERIIWNGDTVYNYDNQILTYELNE